MFKGIRLSLVKATSPWQLEEAAVDEGGYEYKRGVTRVGGEGRLGLYEGHYYYYYYQSEVSYPETEDLITHMGILHMTSYRRLRRVLSSLAIFFQPLESAGGNMTVL